VDAFSAPPRHRARRIIVAGLLTVACAWSLAGAPAVHAGQTPDVAEDPDVVRARAQLDAFRRDLATLTAQLDAAAASYESAQAHHLRLEAELDDADALVARQQQETEEAENAFRVRVAGAYKRPGSEMAFASAVLLAPDAATAVHRAALVSRMPGRSALHLERAQRLDAAVADLVHQQRVTHSGALGAAADRRRLAEELTLALSAARHRVEVATAELADAEAAAVRRAEEEERERRAAAAAAAAAQAAGPLPPVDGKVCPIGAPNGFIDSWGFPRSGGRRHQGVDIFADYGMPLYAVADGVIQRVFTNRLGGLSINLIDDAGDRYYYAHLSAAHVSTGQRVQAGELIGANGDSGNARGGPPHLHWQYHPGNGAPVNPYPLARALCRP
jgi:peptidoglycan LD-endopeptidase LytH